MRARRAIYDRNKAQSSVYSECETDLAHGKFVRDTWCRRGRFCLPSNSTGRTSILLLEAPSARITRGGLPPMARANAIVLPNSLLESYHMSQPES